MLINKNWHLKTKQLSFFLCVIINGSTDRYNVELQYVLRADFDRFFKHREDDSTVFFFFFQCVHYTSSVTRTIYLTMLTLLKMGHTQIKLNEIKLLNQDYSMISKKIAPLYQIAANLRNETVIMPMSCNNQHLLQLSCLVRLNKVVRVAKSIK